MSFSTYFDRSSWFLDKGTKNDDVSLTDQSFKFEADIHNLLVNYQGTTRTPVYDIDNYSTGSWTFEDWQNEKARIERRFLNLTPDMRARFGNAQEFLKFCANPENYQLESSEIKEPVTVQKESAENKEAP